MKLALTEFSLRRPRTVLVIVALLTLVFAALMPAVKFDNDPENMLAADEPVRLFHHEVKETFALYDFVVVGVVNDQNPDGIFNVATLGHVNELTAELISLRRGADGLPVVTKTDANGNAKDEVIDLRPTSFFQKFLNVIFRHDPNRFFDEQGNSAIVASEVIAPSLVDNIKQAQQGSLKLEYLMEHPPANVEEAHVIRDDAMGNPLYKGTLVSEDGKAICLYLPMRDKTFSFTVAQLVRHLTADWSEDDQVYITGLPVAEDTFGVEMLVQMATSAPLAGIAIFILMFLFFRRLNLIIAPMIVAVVSIIFTMGMLIGLGYDVHIMSSMIAIFLMPIAVADAIHILSEFYDAYPRFEDKRKTLVHVVGHLFSPMLYTSLTTMAGFASLATTPIPPVKVFGLHVAFGVGVAWVLTMTLVPAYVMLFVSKKSLSGLITQDQPTTEGRMGKALERVGVLSYRNARLIMIFTAVLVAIAVYGISRIQVNDNPVNWFEPDHEIRIADKVLNSHFGGTYTAYLTFKSTPTSTQVDTAALLQRADKELVDSADGLRQYHGAVEGLSDATRDPSRFFSELKVKSSAIDEQLSQGWQTVADELNFMETEGLTLAAVKQAAASWTVAEVERQGFLTQLETLNPSSGQELQQAALNLCDQRVKQTFLNFTTSLELETTAPAFKRPEVLAYLKGFSTFLAADPIVGKTTSVVDALEKAAYELRFQSPLGPGAEAIAQANKANFSVPDSIPAVAQVYSPLEGMKRKDALFHLVTRDYNEANIWVQLKSGDNRGMERVVSLADTYFAEHQPPQALEMGWAGLTYINVAWQERMVNGMLNALLSSFVIVFLMMIFLFRSVWFGVLAMIPLTVTITLTYGLIGLVGKEYDMPIAVLSSLTLGLSVDFAIHFLQRSRELQASQGSWFKAIPLMFKEPAMAISRNAITISVGFTPLLLAPLMPYKTVGFFLATIMAVSWLSTLFILAALVTLLRRRLFAKDLDTTEVTHVVD